MPQGEQEGRVETCGCGLWICRDCRPENFDPDHPLNRMRDFQFATLDRLLARAKARKVAR